jgi:hypothetical protein
MDASTAYFPLAETDIAQLNPPEERPRNSIVTRWSLVNKYEKYFEKTRYWGMTRYQGRGLGDSPPRQTSVLHPGADTLPLGERRTSGKVSRPAGPDQ